MPTNDYNDPHETNTESGSGDAGPMMPIGTGDLREESIDPLAGSFGSGPKIRSSTILLIAVIVLAGVGLFSMRFLAKVTAGVSTNAQIEKTIDEFFNGWTGDKGSSGSVDKLVVKNEEVLVVLSDDYTDRQVALEDVQKNPFLDTEVATIAGAPTSGGPTRFESIRAQKQDAIEEAVRGMTLKSVIMGSTPLANLDGRIVRLGETFEIKGKDVFFRATDITEDSITLVSDVPELELTITTTLRLKKAL